MPIFTFSSIVRTEVFKTKLQSAAHILTLRTVCVSMCSVTSLYQCTLLTKKKDQQKKDKIILFYFGIEVTNIEVLKLNLWQLQSE